MLNLFWGYTSKVPILPRSKSDMAFSYSEVPRVYLCYDHYCPRYHRPRAHCAYRRTDNGHANAPNCRHCYAVITRPLRRRCAEAAGPCETYEAPGKTS